MQTVEEPTERGTVTVIGPSLALDLSWAAHSVWSPRLRVQHPILGLLSERHPDLLRSIHDFWSDGVSCFPELQVLAYSAGALEEVEFPRLFDLLGRARALVPDDLPLRSETDGDRRAILDRLAELRDDDERWADYVELFGALYASLDEWWRSTAMPAVEQGVVAAWRELARGTQWTRMVPTGCPITHERLPGIAERGEPVVLAICALFGQGLYLDLPDFQLLGLGAGLGELGARARTGDLARRIRVLADPTRLAILDHLRNGPRSVGDIAVDFGLTQPTVSVHMKQLRQAGLVDATRRGARLELSVNSGALQALAGELSTMVSP
jgi:DNA-binding transcriptional ArsR family regulator